MFPTRVRRLVLAVAALMSAVACAPVLVRSFTSRDASFARYRTYAWSEQPQRATGDPRLDANPFFEQRIRAGAERELAAHGLEKTSEPPDLLLHYHASVTQKLDVPAGDVQYGNCDDCFQASTYDAGTIMLDLVDARTRSLVWRAWAEGAFEGVVDDQAWLEARIDTAVARIAATLPRRQGSSGDERSRR